MKLGRNDPCHCGSGRKYKHCHYEEDRAAEAKELREAEEARAKAVEAEAGATEEQVGEKTGDPADARAAARAESTGRPRPGGSQFMRDSSHGKQGGSKSQTGTSGSHAPRTTRGAQRGG